MDYSASIDDPDHPVEASPWGNSPSSTPQHNRTGFASNITGLAGEDDAPGSPFSSNGLHDEGGFGGGDTEYRRPDTASTVSQTPEPRDEPTPAEYQENKPPQPAIRGRCPRHRSSSRDPHPTRRNEPSSSSPGNPHRRNSSCRLRLLGLSAPDARIPS